MIFEKRLPVGFALVLVCLAQAVLADDKKAVEEVKASSEEVITSLQKDAKDADVIAEKKEYNPLQARNFKASYVTVATVTSTTESYYTTCRTALDTGTTCSRRRRRRSVAVVDVPDDSIGAPLHSSLDSFDRHSLTLGSPAAEGRDGNVVLFKIFSTVTTTLTSTFSTINTATTIQVSVACSFTPADGYTVQELYLRACA